MPGGWLFFIFHIDLLYNRELSGDQRKLEDGEIGGYVLHPFLSNSLFSLPGSGLTMTVLLYAGPEFMLDGPCGMATVLISFQ